MQAHLRSVEKLTNFFSPVGLHISHYSSNQRRKRRRISNIAQQTAPSIHTTPDGNIVVNRNNNNNYPMPLLQMAPSAMSDEKHSTSVTVNNNNASTTSSAKIAGMHIIIGQQQSSKTETKSNSTIKTTTINNTSNSLSLKLHKNRAIFKQLSNIPGMDLNMVFDKLITYGFETSADIARMQPWQLRVLKNEFQFIDNIYLVAYQMYGTQEMYDDKDNKAWRQFYYPAIWLQYNEIELISHSFQEKLRGYKCVICGSTSGLSQLDLLRWHMWLDHRNCPQFHGLILSSKQVWMPTNMQLPHPTTSMYLPSLDININAVDARPTVISLLDDSSDDDVIHVSQLRTRKLRSQRRSISPKKMKRNVFSAVKKKSDSPAIVQIPIIVDEHHQNSDKSDIDIDTEKYEPFEWNHMYTAQQSVNKKAEQMSVSLQKEYENLSPTILETLEKMNRDAQNKNNNQSLFNLDSEMENNLSFEMNGSDNEIDFNSILNIGGYHSNSNSNLASMAMDNTMGNGTSQFADDMLFFGNGMSRSSSGNGISALNDGSIMFPFGI